jgi:hypothetical protein
MRLVGFKKIIAKGSPGRVKNDPDVRCFMGGDESTEHVGNPENCPGRLAFRIIQRGERMVGPIEKRRAIDEN